MFGSTWKKWDLHFHTQTSYDYEDKSITDENLIETLVSKGVEVVAITDHHSINKERIKNLQKLGEGRLTILPGIEFLSDARGDEPIHFIAIFDELCDIDFVWKQIESRTDIKRIQGEGKKYNEVYCHLLDTIQLIKELNGIVTIHSGSKSNGIENITHSLKHALAQKEDIARAIDIFEVGKEDDIDGYKTKVIPYILKAIGKRIPVILCSDNHNVKNYLTKQNLWIKADSTFEGLRQILFEPQYRVHIGEFPPINPPIRISKVILDFPLDSKFENEIFCLAGKRELHFSPNFTCIIGGRGTGKSTILNLIHEKLKIGENQFFKDRKIKDVSGKTISIDSCIKIDNDDEEKYVEFLSQNEIEDFAQNYHKLTAAVYARIIKRDEEGKILEYETLLKEKLNLFRTYIVKKRRLSSLKLELEQKRKELETNKKIIDSFSSKEYTDINEEIKKISRAFNDLNYAKNKYSDLIKDLEEILKKYSINQQNASAYLSEIIGIITALKKIIEESSKVDFAQVEKISAEQKEKIQEKKNELATYLLNKGLTEENLNDIANSNILANRLEIEIQSVAEEIETTQRRLDEFDKQGMLQISTEYQAELEKQIKAISTILEKVEGKSVKPISLHLDFDVSTANEKVFQDFKLAFEGQINKSSHKGDSILRDVLFCILPKEISDKETFLSTLKSYSTSSSAKTFLIDLFTEDINFEIYQLICERTFLDYSEFKKIRVQYDSRPIENSSFGQRCTAVLVILLLLGNNPIIIDEPEAHLDSLLISNYLVDLIKDKKQNRQIIFATHNANLVINGDAELIHILDINEFTQTTSITSTTIENTKTKEILIGLEGGKEAFIKRESKYQFR
ncbi:TrlF family AAA-like ATPase [Lacibacter sp. H375]|uniref:TrlF family AAA-like ATPase n=1 Tax=Lacibacter sp. H375 TaxID=3133424 RepID=UPI0030C2E63D